MHIKWYYYYYTIILYFIYFCFLLFASFFKDDPQWLYWHIFYHSEIYSTWSFISWSQFHNILAHHIENDKLNKLLIKQEGHLTTFQEHLEDGKISICMSEKGSTTADFAEVRRLKNSTRVDFQITVRYKCLYVRNL